ncbi:MAG: hypothetical protein ACI4S2_14695 [Lachnospiraceae bacterium]
MKMGMRKYAAFLIMIALTVWAITGCGMKEKDAKAYVQATLDANYKGDFKEYIEITDSTEEEAKEIYENNMNIVMSSFVESDNITDEMNAKYKKLFQDIYAKANYTIGEVEKTGEGFDVEVKTAQFQVFDGVEDELVEKATKEVEKSKEQLSEEEIDTIACEVLYELLSDKVNNPVYENEQSLTVKIIKDSDGVWMIPEEYLDEIDKALFR